MTDKAVVDDNYWPNPIKEISFEKPWEEQHIIVAQITTPWGDRSYRHIYTALVPLELKESILASSGGVGHDVTTTGPHPSPFRGTLKYVPRFSIFATEIYPQGLEPLVVAWRTGNRIVLSPDQGFLMTYGLVPRIVKSEHGDLIYWDDIERPYYDVVIAKMVSEYYFGGKYDAFVTIDRKYLQDYATARNCSLVQVYYATNVGPMSVEDRKIFSKKNVQEFKLKGRLVNIRIDSESRDQIIAQIWGVRHLIDPLDSPIIEGRWDYGELFWPGIEGVVTDDRSQRLGMQYVYVDDKVLQFYEQQPGKYSIHPENGGVSYQNQWSVSYSQRVYRNLIKLEIRKLYEGCPPDVVKHWNKYAVDPPAGNLRQLISGPNVASRSKRIVYALVNLGEILSTISNEITNGSLTSEDFVKLSLNKLDYYGWWNEQNIIPITRHIPLDMGEDKFLNRCRDLNSLVTESFNEGNLRKLLLDLGVNSPSIKDFRGLKLLDTLVQYALISIRAGLSFVKDAKEIEGRRLETIAKLKPEQHLETPIHILFVLYDLRIGATHRGKKIEKLLERLGINKALVVAGYGKELDKLYDSIAEALQQMTKILSDAFTA